ncbi:hypothetical protein [[Actinomadura] parvosata]|uniref:hypothetical protein n=1 Tax=[Actinomadura] parvosata TaxID=1955412 RepID=UPI0012BC5A00|nr:hypothetical protein [Nonomuraea sp. ATCC 55076]
MTTASGWVRHLSWNERRAFALELVEALSGPAAVDVGVAAREVVAGWRATARIKADPLEYAKAREATSGDFGEVQVSA